MSTIWAPGFFFSLGTWITPSTRVRVVCGLGLTIASFSPARAFIRVDLPALGFPTMHTNPEWKAMLDELHLVRIGNGDAHAFNPARRGLQYFETQIFFLHNFAFLRDAPGNLADQSGNRRRIL